MNIFSYIGQKVYNSHDEIYFIENNSTTKCNNNLFLFWQKIYEKEYKQNRYNLGKAFVYSYMYDYHFYEQNPITFLSKYIENIFFIEERKNKIIEVFCKIQKIYYTFSKIAKIFRFKKAHLYTSCDLKLEEIKETQTNVISVIQGKHKYLFTVPDILTIIRNAICNTSYMFSESLTIKNPYNNIPFTKSSLYNIYFFIKFKSFVMPDFLQSFFLLNFDIGKFEKECEYIIRKYAINSHFIGMSKTEKEDTIKIMISFYNRLCYGISDIKIKLDINFPSDKLIETFSPYALLFLKYKYTNCNILKNNYKSELIEKLKKFISNNIDFGKKMLKHKGSKIFNTFVTDYFVPSDDVDFMKTHIKEYNNNDSDSDNDSYSDTTRVVTSTFNNNTTRETLFYDDNVNVGSRRHRIFLNGTESISLITINGYYIENNSNINDDSSDDTTVVTNTNNNSSNNINHDADTEEVANDDASVSDMNVDVDVDVDVNSIDIVNS